MSSLYKSEQGKLEIFKLYDDKLNELNIDYVIKTINTNFGETNVIVTGDQSKPPIVIIHGSNGCAPIAIETYADLM
ncbi:alpha/beta hydrolase, partial [bacterium]|nr:alpha/beta hydrolase [bacterium]